LDYYYYFFKDSGTQFPENKKNTLCNTKSTKIKLLLGPYYYHHRHHRLIILFVFKLALLCFSVATEFSVNNISMPFLQGPPACGVAKHTPRNVRRLLQ